MSAVAVPASFRPDSVAFTLLANQRLHASPFGGSEQVVDMLNDRWSLSLTIPMRLQADAAVIEAFLAQLRGMVNTAALWHFVRPVPRGTMRGSPTLNGAHSAGASSIAITGGTADSTLLAGDMLGLGGLLLMVAADVTLNGSGAGTVTLANRLRAAQSGGASITWNRPTAPFRLQRAASVRYSGVVADQVALDFLEAV